MIEAKGFYIQNTEFLPLFLGVGLGGRWGGGCDCGGWVEGVVVEVGEGVVVEVGERGGGCGVWEGGVCWECGVCGCVHLCGER